MSKKRRKSFLKRNILFPILFSFLSLAVLFATVAVVQQRQVLRSSAIWIGTSFPTPKGFSAKCNTDRNVTLSWEETVRERPPKNFHIQKLKENKEWGPPKECGADNLGKKGDTGCFEHKDTALTYKYRAAEGRYRAKMRFRDSTLLGGHLTSDWTSWREFYCGVEQTAKCNKQGGLCTKGGCPAGKGPTHDGSCTGSGVVCCVKKGSTATGAGSSGGGGGAGGGVSETGGSTGGVPGGKSCVPENQCAASTQYNGQCCPGLVKNTNTLCHVCVKSENLNPSTATPTLTPTITPTPTPKVGDATLDIKLRFQGITKQPESQFNKMTVLVSLSEEQFEEATFTSDANGVWTGKASFNDVPIDSPLAIFIKGPKHIQKKICDLSPSESTPGTYSCNEGAIKLKAGESNLDFSNILQLAGDLPEQDGVVDSSDVAFVRQHLTSTKSEDLVVGDVNLNGVIDSQDYSLVLAALSIKTDDAL